jgi:hypothetical protein
MRRKLSDPLVSSHALFVLNSVLYAYSTFYLLASLLLVCTFASTMYHIHAESNAFWQRADKTMCLISVSAILTTLILHADYISISICLCWLTLSLLLYKISPKNYAVFHLLWHFAVFIGNVLVWRFLP